MIIHYICEQILLTTGDLLTKTLLLNEYKTKLLNIPNNLDNFPDVIIYVTVVNIGNTCRRSITDHGIEIYCNLRLKNQITSVCKKVNIVLH